MGGGATGHGPRPSRPTFLLAAHVATWAGSRKVGRERDGPRTGGPCQAGVRRRLKLEGMVIALVRHGQTDWNLQQRMQGTSDIPLNAVGREQARQAGILLAEENWDVVVSSPLKRARETAEIIAAELRLPLGSSYPELVEQDFGEAEGMEVTEVLERWPDWQAPGREPDHEVGARGVRALQAIADEFGEANVVAVAHGTIIRATIAEIAGRPRADYAHLENGSSSLVHLHEEGWRALTFGGEPLGVEVENA